ncbi:PilW family protein [Methylibium petroleiphilum]
MSMARARLSNSRELRGFSLVELLVAVAIGLVVTLAVFGVLAASEGRKRTSVSLNDANQSGAYAAYTLDRLIRSAGSGFADGWARVGACRLNARLPEGQTWPRTTDLPAPFAGVPQTLRLAPIVIFQGASGAGSDVLMVMSGSAGFGESPATLLPRSGADVAANQWRLNNTIGFGSRELVMLSGGGECLLTQLTAGFSGGATQALPFDTTGAYYTATGANTSLVALAALSSADAFSIGSLEDPTATPPKPANPPQFQLFGVGDNSTLFSYDLLLINGQNAPLPLAEGVVALRAVYGVDTNDNGVIDDWVAPTGTTWGGAALMDGSAASAANLRRIVAVRLGLVMRSSLVERENVAPATLNLFADLSSGGTPGALTRTVTIAAADQTMRHRTIELTVPVRNLLLRP